MYITYLEKESCLSGEKTITANCELIIESILNTAKITRGKIYLNADCSRLKIVPNDQYSSGHYLLLAIKNDLNVAIVDHTLPDTTGKLFNFTGNIESYAAKFFEYLDQMAEFYCNMNAIDELCFVVEPVEASTKCNSRIIKLDEKVFMKIIVDPLLPSSISVGFFGPTTLVEFYRDKYRAGINDWNADEDIYRNFLKIFETVALPQKPIDGSIGEQTYCSICYLYRLNGQIPMITCDNSRCHLVYHTPCLKEWFSSIRESKTFLNVTSGNCPSCKEKLSASFVQLIGV